MTKRILLIIAFLLLSFNQAGAETDPNIGCCIKDSSLRNNPANCTQNVQQANCSGFFVFADPACSSDMAKPYCQPAPTGCCVTAIDPPNPSNCNKSSIQNETCRLFVQGDNDCTSSTVQRYCTAPTSTNPQTNSISNPVPSPQNATGDLTRSGSPIYNPSQSSAAKTCTKSASEGWGPFSFKGSLVPCGRSCDDPGTPVNEGQECTLCHMLILVQNIFNLIRAMLFIISFLIITVAGVIYIVSTGQSGMKSLAKSLITNTIKGFAIFMVSWLMVIFVLKAIAYKSNVLESAGLFTFTCNTMSEFQRKTDEQRAKMGQPTSTTAGSQQTTTPTTTTTPGANLSDAEARQRLQAAGIPVTSSGSCSDQNNPRCTSLQGLPSNAVDNLIAMKQTCGNVAVTGGTETGHASHGTGRPVVDLSRNSDYACIYNNRDKFNISRICTTPAYSQYRVNCDYNEGDEHLHVVF